MRGVVVAAMAAFVLGACGRKAPPGDAGLALPPAPAGETSLRQPPAEVAGAAYMPLAAGNSWTYRATSVIGDISETKERTFEVFDDENDSFRIEEAGKGLINAVRMYYAVQDDGVMVGRGMLGAVKTEYDPPAVLLPTTFGPRAQWEWQGTSGGHPVAMTSTCEGMETVTVPAGTYECLRIHRVFGGKVVMRHWHAEGVGIVKAVITRPAGGRFPPSNEVLELLSSQIR